MFLAHLLHLGSGHGGHRCPFIHLCWECLWSFPRPDRIHNLPGLFWICPEVFAFPAGQKYLLPGGISNYLICLFSTQRNCGSVWISLWKSELFTLFPRMSTFGYFRVERAVKQAPPFLAQLSLHHISQGAGHTDECAGVSWLVQFLYDLMIIF